MLLHLQCSRLLSFCFVKNLFVKCGKFTCIGDSIIEGKGKEMKVKGMKFPFAIPFHRGERERGERGRG